MKIAFLIIYILLYTNSFAQLKSYNESESVVKMSFDMADSQSEDFTILIGAKPEYELQVNLLPKSNNIPEKLNQLFKEVACEACSLYRKVEMIDEDPIDFIFENIEEQKVYEVTKNDKVYFVSEYGPKN
tara:strand:- start:299 stop:685 length:387 start_codon:yes stop_codon:yes gene_type:complete